MKILVLTDRYPPYYEGGYEINCAVKAKGLEGKNHDITVLTSRYGVGGNVREGNICRYMHPLAAESGRGLSKRLAQLKNAVLVRLNYRIAKRIAKEVEPDLAYIWSMDNVSIFPVVAMCDRKIPVVYELGDYWLLKCKAEFVLEKSLMKRLYRKALFGGYAFEKLDFTNMIIVSQALQKSYIKNHFSGGNTTIIPAGVSRKFVVTQEPFAVRKNYEEFRLLFAGRIVEEKGVHIAVEAVRHILDSLHVGNIHLDIIGNGKEEYIQKLDKLIQSLQLRNHVTMRDQIPHQSLMDEYAKHDVFLFPSTWDEPLGMTIIEAMAKGLPVVASHVGGVPEIIEDGVNGLLVPPGDPEKLADAVKKLWNDMSLCSSLRARATQTVLKKFTYEEIVEQTEHYLLDIAHADIGRRK